MSSILNSEKKHKKTTQQHNSIEQQQQQFQKIFEIIDNQPLLTFGNRRLSGHHLLVAGKTNPCVRKLFEGVSIKKIRVIVVYRLRLLIRIHRSGLQHFDQLLMSFAIIVPFDRFRHLGSCPNDFMRFG
jgi:hypothetical protein